VVSRQQLALRLSREGVRELIWLLLFIFFALAVSAVSIYLLLQLPQRERLSKKKLSALVLGGAAAAVLALVSGFLAYQTL